VIDRRQRRGFVLVLAILAVIVAGALIVATHAAVNLEHTAAGAAIGRQRAFAASEYGLWFSVANWEAANLTLAPGGARTAVIRGAGDSATITTVRLNDDVYWITADAQVGDPARRARRRTGINVYVVSDSTGVRVTPVPRSWADLH